MIELLLQAEAALSAGRLDRAESLYRQVADADPRNSIAVVGLARVAAERSDEVGALTLARRALSIDPENAAAQRTVRQLEEVLTSRGVSAPATEAASSPTAASTEPLAAAGDARGPATPDRSAATPPRRSYVDRLLRRASDR